MIGYDIFELSRILRGSKTNLTLEKTLKWWKFSALLNKTMDDIRTVISQGDDKEAREAYLAKEFPIEVEPFITVEELFSLSETNQWPTGVSLILRDILVL